MGGAESEVYVPPQFKQQQGEENQVAVNSTSDANAGHHPVQNASVGHEEQVHASPATAEASTGVAGTTDDNNNPGNTTKSKGAVELLQDAANCANKINQQQRMFRGYLNKLKRSAVAIRNAFNMIASCCKNKG
jgi:hypothetical protein